MKMGLSRIPRLCASLLVAGSAVGASAQNHVLSLSDAMSMAQRNNGTIRAARYSQAIAESRARFDFGAFLPSVSTNYRYESSRLRQDGSTFRTDEGFPSINASWTIFDLGLRDLGYRASKQGALQARADAVQTLRETLFVVAQQFLNGLRAQELVRVRSASVERAEELLKATDAQIAAKQIPAIDRLQANADLLNARVDYLGASNSLTTTLSLLKALIGLESGVQQTSLQSVQPEPMKELPSLAEVLRTGIANREDLKARRFGLESQRLSVEQTKREAGLSVTLDANYSRNWSDSEVDSRNLTLLASYPLFDGQQRRELVRQAQLALDSQRSGYAQAERDALAEIESAYLELKQNRERSTAAQEALNAAKENYVAASEAQKLGAEGTNVISVLTAKISLVTAESNAVEALYDVFVSEMRLKLATGQPMPGESL